MIQSRKRRNETKMYIMLAVVLAVFALLAVGLMSFIFYGVEADSITLNVPALPMTSDGSADSLAKVGYGDIFHVSTWDELELLISSGNVSEYYKTNKTEPTVMLADGITVESDVTFDCGVELLFLGNADFSNGAKIKVETCDECEISIITNENYASFAVEAPRAELFWRGGDVPFMYEVARYMNVAEYNGSPVTDGGDKLGGVGTATLDGIKLYTGKKKTTEADADVVINGNLVTLYYPYGFDYDDIGAAYIDVISDGECTSDTSKSFDLSTPQLISVADGDGEVRTYRLTAERKSYGIPILSIDTESGKDIASKTVYERASMTLDGESYTLNVRGRGNASWRIFPKHAYRLKLDEKAKILGMTSNRDWVLVSNYADPSLIRNNVASDMAKRLDGLGFTPTHVAVDLYINGVYQGLYMIAEKIEDAKSRVDLGEPVYDGDGNVTDFGFLLEFGWDYDSENVYGKDYFNTTYCKRVYIKEPEITEAKNDTYKYIYNYIKSVDDAISKDGDWQSLIDVDSWVDWFIVNELTNNTECVFYRSLYMYKPAGGKLTAGPIWDYDMAFGNHLDDIKGYDGWVSVDSTYGYLYQNWMYFLLRDEYFVSCIKSRWAEVKEDLLQTALDSIDENADIIREAQVNNFAVWPKVLKYQIGVSTASTLVHTWEGHLDYIRNFVNDRYEWMDERLTREGSILD